MIVYSYELAPLAGEELRFLDAIGRLESALGQLAGFRRARLDREVETDLYRFDEEWLSAEAHDAEAPRLDGTLLTALTATLREPPRRRIFIAP